MISKLKTLAKLYLDGKPAEIAEQTIDAFCEWIMTEFQQLPFAVQASDFMGYETAAEMFADIEQGHLWESVENYDSEIYPNPFYGFALLAIHDYDHYLCQSDFSLEGEIAAYKEAANRATSLEMQKILYSEIVMKSAARIYLGYTPKSKVVFP
ncbi:MAG: transposase [Pleurocapsa sp. MO_192.B19]|nr:transposase [Pleurocapsa sp. MO_192.B19]